jgi:hypothetical protein
MVERIFSASASGRRGRAPSQIDLIEASISPEEIARRRTEQRKRELIDARRKGFEITMPSDFGWDTFAPWVVRVSDQTVWGSQAHRRTDTSPRRIASSFTTTVRGATCTDGTIPSGTTRRLGFGQQRLTSAAI